MPSENKNGNAALKEKIDAKEMKRQRWIKDLEEQLARKTKLRNSERLAEEWMILGGVFDQLPKSIQGLHLQEYTMGNWGDNTLFYNCIGRGQLKIKSLALWRQACKGNPTARTLEQQEGMTTACIWLATQQKAETRLGFYNTDTIYRQWANFAKASAKAEGLASERLIHAFHISAEAARKLIAETPPESVTRGQAIRTFSYCADLAKRMGLTPTISAAYKLEYQLELKKAKEQVIGSGETISEDLQWTQTLWHTVMDNAEIVFKSVLDHLAQSAPQELERPWEMKSIGWEKLKTMRLLDYCLLNGRYSMAHQLLDAGVQFLKPGLSNPFVEFRRNVAHNKKNNVQEQDRMFTRLQTKANEELQKRGFSAADSKGQIDKWHNSSLQNLTSLKSKSAFERIVLNEMSEGGACAQKKPAKRKPANTCRI